MKQKQEGGKKKDSRKFSQDRDQEHGRRNRETGQNKIGKQTVTEQYGNNESNRKQK